jgi:hypothetical protein
MRRRIKVMSRLTPVLASVVLISLVASRSHARTRTPKEAPGDSTIGAKLASRIPCDGVTNPEDQVSLITTCSPVGAELSFRIEVYADKFCKRGDLGWACVQPGHATWKQEWSAESTVPTATSLYGLSSCEESGSNNAPQIILTGWYKEQGPTAKDDVWKQVEVKKAASRWETYQFTGPDGGTAKIELDRR